MEAGIQDDANTADKFVKVSFKIEQIKILSRADINFIWVIRPEIKSNFCTITTLSTKCFDCLPNQGKQNQT